MHPRIHRFSPELCTWPGDDFESAKFVLGGKGAGLVRMCRLGLPIPPGFTITTADCNHYRGLGVEDREAFLDALMIEVEDCMQWLEGLFGFRPLVSVRSGAPFSMPGMMDTILNVGLCTANFSAWCERIGGRATFDTDRRLTQMLGATAFGVPAEVFEFQLAKVKKAHKVKSDTDLDRVQISEVIFAYREAFEKHTGFKFPFDDPGRQMRAAIKAVFDSWMNPRAVEYRRLNGISEEVGTAVNVQSMVFGNMGNTSGTGVLFTRDPSTGACGPMGEFLVNAQGEDVVAGIRTPLNLTRMASMKGPAREMWQVIRDELDEVCVRLEEAYRDMVDIEFTVQDGKLFILQSRVGKRSARAAFRIAAEMVEDDRITPIEAFGRLSVAQFKMVKRPIVDPSFAVKANATGLPACPGVAVGRAVFSKEEALACGEPCILVTEETTPDDIAGMAKAVGVLTKTGGATSHAAVVARSMDKPCVVGVGEALDLQALKELQALQGEVRLTLDGATGRVWLGIDVPVIDASEDEALQSIAKLAHRTLGTVSQPPRGEIPDLLSGEAVRVSIRENWCDLQWLSRMLDQIAQVPFRKHITLDVRPPNAGLDAQVDQIFGPAVRRRQSEALRDLLCARWADYVGCQVIWDLELGTMPVQLGNALPFMGTGRADRGARAVPDDYAVFLVLSA